MNNRIQELSKEAGELAGLVYNPPVRSKSLTKIWEDGHIPFSDLYNASLAELIVRECCKEIEKAPFNSRDASVWLKQYFEIKD